MRTWKRTTAIFFFFLAGCAAPFAHAQQLPPARVVVAEAVSQELASEQSFVATILPLKRAVVGSAVDGRVVELVAQEGERVGELKPLVTLLTSTIELELAAAEAELEIRKQELTELENGSRPNEIEQAKARMLGAKASAEYARTSRIRAQRLRDAGGGSITEDDYERAVATSLQADHAYLEAVALYELAVEGPRPERIAQARAQVVRQQAMVDHIRDRIQKYTVISRFNGYVITEFVEEGTWVKAGDPVMEVVALDEVEVQAFVVEEHVPYIQLGTKVPVEVPALPGRSFTGVVTRIVPQADTRARTFPVKVRVQNEISESGPLLKSGMYARVKLPTGAVQQAVMVPKDALVLGGPQTMVYVVQGNGDQQAKATPVPVELGIARTNSIQVSGNIQAGQMVVVEGNERLRPGQDVVIAGAAKPPLAPANEP